MEKMIAVVGGLQEHQAIKTDGICVTLCSAMGIGGGNTPLVIYKIDGSGKSCGGTQQIKVLVNGSKGGTCKWK